MATDHLTIDGLVKGFYNSFTDEEDFKGTEETYQFAQAIVERGEEAWNWPTAVEDAERFIAENA